MAERPPPAALADALGAVLGGEVRDLRRLSSGASRITSAFDLHDASGIRALIIQQDRGGGAGSKAALESALLRAAATVGVPVPAVVASGDGARDGLGSAWLVAERLEGETIPRKILRDDEWAQARPVLTQQCGEALAAIHTIDPASIPLSPWADPFATPLPLLDMLGEPRPALELGLRWLEANRPPDGPRVLVHGDFRCGNFLVGRDGLRAVLDWELAHAGQAAEDIGWLCAPAWRFGGPGEVGGFGSMPDFLAAYVGAGGAPVEPEVVQWWIVYATVKWAVICALQASTHLNGVTRSVELAAIGRRVCESEWDLCTLLGFEVADDPPEAVTNQEALPPFGRPTARELVEAVRESVEADMARQGDVGARFGARVTRNVLLTVERELALGPVMAVAHAARLASLGFDDDAALAAAIRAGALDPSWPEVGAVVASAARDQLLVANPSYLPATSA